jgi:transcriptional regulator with XRE-family HTH domain
MICGMARPRGKRLNPDAFDDAVSRHPNGPFTKTEVASGADISPGTLADLYGGRRRASEEIVRNLAQFLNVRPGTLFPELGPFVERDDALTLEAAS